MIKTLALFLDAYRELNAKRMFWIVLIISAVVVAVFGIIGIRNDAVTVCNWETPLRFVYLSLISPATFYKLMFVSLGIKFWLASLATILALISTAGMFPDFLAGGSIDLYLSKPISRLRLFTTKYVVGLLFVTLQVVIFCTASFLVLGFRGGTWEPALFLAVPLVVLMFSYLFAMCVLLGVVTRSTIAALLLTLLFWGALWAVHTTEILLLRAQLFDQRHAARLDKEIAGSLHSPTTASTSASSGTGWWGRWVDSAPRQTPAEADAHIEELRQERSKITDRFGTAHRVALAVATPLPKTSETIGLLERELIARADLPQPSDEDAPDQTADRPAFRGRGREDRVVTSELDQILRQRSISWVLGTSCAFEAAILVLAAWIFCRRDY
jgi:ABC-type transport system involved in multi-copper enzyme maturation permease subunit